MTEHTHSDECRPNCRFRRLYEGSQVSLTDMSSRQAAALSRVGRLRAGLVTALRRAFPEQAAAAEAQMGRRLADVDDEVLLAFLDSLLRTSTGREERAMLDALAAALAVSGIIDDPSSTPASWIPEIGRARRMQHTAPVAPQTQPHQAAAAAPAAVSPAHASLATASLVPHEQPVSTGTAPSPSDRVTVPLDSLFGDAPVINNSENDFDLGWDDPLDHEPVLVDAGTPAALDELFGAVGTAPAHTTSAPAPVPTVHDRLDTQAPAPAQPDVTPLVDLWPDERLGNPAPSGDSWTPSPIRPNEETRTTPAPPAAVPPPTVFESVVRPELFPSTPKSSRSKSSAKKRTTRIQAEAPADSSDAAPFQPTAPAEHRDGLDDVLRQALLAAASIPRPVFTRDLVAIAGTPEVVSVWEDECRAHPELTQVRFVSPKARHRARGSLIIPDDSLRATPRRGYDDWWVQAINRYFGARLYELGVLLHRVGDELVSTRFGEQTAVLRLNSSRGLVGIVVAMNDRLEPGEPAREELAAALEELFAERLTLAAVLMSAGEERDLTRLVEATVGLASERGWNPAFPVVSARSWEYADDRGSTARVILGG
jgi:hypothetical protein